MSFLKELIVLDDEIFNYSDWSSSDDEENEVNHRISSENGKENKVEISFIVLKDAFISNQEWKVIIESCSIKQIWIKHT